MKNGDRENEEESGAPEHHVGFAEQDIKRQPVLV
jgi:hypothetical protein